MFPYKTRETFYDLIYNYIQLSGCLRTKFRNVPCKTRNIFPKTKKEKKKKEKMSTGIRIPWQATKRVYPVLSFAWCWRSAASSLFPVISVGFFAQEETRTLGVKDAEEDSSPRLPRSLRLSAFSSLPLSPWSLHSVRFMIPRRNVEWAPVSLLTNQSKEEDEARQLLVAANPE